MAAFRTHISFGFILAIAVAVGSLILSLVSNVFFATIMAVATLIGSALPDLDSDDGLPFRITFWSTAIVVAGIVFYYFFQNGMKEPVLLIGAPIVSFFFVRYIVGGIFQKFSHHRGMFHSLPAATIFALLSYLLADLFSLGQTERQMLAYGVGIGYLGHLVLDEIYAMINFQGLKFKPKKSLGSALKFFSGSTTANVFTYSLLLILLLFIF